MKNVIINSKDNVGVCLGGNDKIPAGHKYALFPIAKGEYVIKYGEIIGRATQDIAQGEWVHTHNVKSHLDENVEYEYEFNANIPEKSKYIFQGFKREYGRAGIRNEIYIIPTVGCVNNACMRLEKAAQKYITGSIDGIFALTHQFDCSQLGEDNTLSELEEKIENRLQEFIKVGTTAADVALQSVYPVAEKADAEEVFAKRRKGENVTERRIRQRGDKKNGFTFYYTEKTDVSNGVRIEDDVYILPSSTHEILAIPSKVAWYTGEKQLKDMVKEVNATHVQPDEFLSDNVYLYRRDTDKIEIV